MDTLCRWRNNFSIMRPKQYMSIGGCAALPSFISGGRYFLVPTVRHSHSFESCGRPHVVAAL